MKTNPLPFLAALALVPFAGAAEATKPACCAADAPAAIAAAPVSARSLYQLDAKWTDDAGATVSLRSFRGQPVVLAMFFASCDYACPMLVNDMIRMRAQLPEDVRAETRFVLVSFDTARDTPAALKAFRERMSLDAHWTLLRSDAGTVRELAMLLGVKYRQDARGQFAHSNLVTVLDREGEVVHQRAGLNGDVSEAARAVVAAAQTR